MDFKTTKGKFHVLVSQGIKNAKSKGKQKVKENNPKSDDEDEGSKFTDEGSKSTDEGSNSMKKNKKKGSSKCSYCCKSFHFEKMDIMSQLLDKYNIYFPYFARKKEPKKPTKSTEQCHNVQSQGNRIYALISRVKSFSQFSDLDSHSNMYEL